MVEREGDKQRREVEGEEKTVIYMHMNKLEADSYSVVDGGGGGGGGSGGRVV